MNGEKICQANIKQKTIGVAMLVSKQIDFLKMTSKK